MQTASKSLSSDTEKRQHQVLDLQSKLSDKNEEIVHLKQRYQHMLEQFRLGQQRQFGQSSESSPNQTELFEEAEQILDKPAAKSPEKAVAGHTRQAPKRKPFPADLPREVIVHDIPDSDKNCTGCGHDLHRMGEDKKLAARIYPSECQSYRACSSEVQLPSLGTARDSGKHQDRTSTVDPDPQELCQRRLIKSNYH